MQKICPLCKQVSADGNLWCQEINCPAGHLSPLLTYGNYLGSYQVVSLLRNWQTAALYVVQRGKNVFLLKVATPGFEVQFKKEASLWKQLASIESDNFMYWLPHEAENQSEPFGVADFRGQTRYYILFKYVKGEFLSDYLLDNPQPWHRHVGWFMCTLAKTIQSINDTGWLLPALNPDGILVVLNRSHIPQPVIIDPGLLILEQNKAIPTVMSNIVSNALATSYIAPEINPTTHEIPTFKAQIYTLGAILFEMLTGHRLPVTDQDLKTNLVQQLESRVDLPQTAPGLSAVLKNMLAPKPGNRAYNSATDLEQSLLAIYGLVPNKRRWFELTRNQSIGMLIGLLILFVAVVVMLILAGIKLAG